MHEGLQKEIATYEKRTPASRKAHKRAEERLPLGVASNYRAYDPYPIFVRDGKGGHIHDIDGNEYIDFNLCFGALKMCIRDSRSTIAEPHHLYRKSFADFFGQFPFEIVRHSEHGSGA